MSDIRSLQNLVNSINIVHQKIEAARGSVLFQSKSTDPKSSEYHSKFNSLMSKFSVFAEEYRSELEQFHKLLINNMSIIEERQRLQKIELERQDLLNKLEILSNANTEITENLQEIESNSAMKSRSPSPIITPVTTPNIVTMQIPKDIRKIAHTKNNKKPVRKNRQKNMKVSTPKPKKIYKKVEKKVDNQKIYEDTPYEYNGSNWSFNGINTTSTVIFIGNLPFSVKEAQINHFVRRRCMIRMDEISQTKIMEGNRGKYCTMRLSHTVPITKINNFINKTNAENERIYKEIQTERERQRNLKNKLKSKKDTKDDGKKVKKEKKCINIENISWKKRVFVKFNQFTNFYKNEYEMYRDRKARHTLFIRNFDILDKDCHSSLTQKLGEFGELYEDIVIRTDGFGDPYCIVAFKYINNAIECCNCNNIEFNERVLQIRYSRD